MPYRLVKGEFHLYYQGARHVGSQPDGDSVWFKPAKPSRLSGIDGRNAKLNGGGFAQLRLEAVDALELHYMGKEQDRAEAEAARDFTLDAAGFRRITFSGSRKLSVRAADPHPRPGWILTKSIDPYGRPISFAFAGTTRRRDGNIVFLEARLLDRSINAALARAGRAFPAYYTGLPASLRRRMTVHANRAWSRDRGVWRRDSSMKGARTSDLQALTTLVLWPKLFRRLVSYFKAGHSTLAGFDAWLRSDHDRDDQLWIISEAHLGRMHELVHVKDDTIRMRYWPEDVVIVPG